MNKVLKATRVIMTLIGTAAVITSAGVSCSADNTQYNSREEAPKTGKYAPDFKLTNLEGEDIYLIDIQGKPVLLNFWASWCGPCIEEMPLIQEIYETRADDGLIILVVNSGESPGQVKQFMQTNGYSFPVLLDSEQTVTSKYRIRGIPTTFFINSDGLIEDMRVGAFTSTAQIEDYLEKIMP